MQQIRTILAAFVVAIIAYSPQMSRAASTHVAVAANFTDAAKDIAAAFKARTGHEAILSFGASGPFYTQIKQGAPFEVFLSADDERPKTLAQEGLAVADSRFTYGAAAIETLKALKLFDAMRAKIVMGSSIAQAFQFIDTGNAELGFIALSQLAGKTEGSRWLVPQSFYTEIRQDAVLLTTGIGNEAAKAFIAFLKGAEAHAIIERYGYVFETK